MAELTSVNIIRRICEENEFLLIKNQNENESFDTDFQEFDSTINFNDLRQFIRTSSFSKNHKTSSLIQDKIKNFENSSTPVKTTPITSKLTKTAPNTKEEEEFSVCRSVTNPFLDAIFINEEKTDMEVFNKSSEANNTTKVSNYTFLMFNNNKN